MLIYCIKNTINNKEYIGLTPMDGKKHTEESKQKIISFLTGRKHSEESKRKRSESMKAFIQNKKLLNNGIQI